jgi:hypothetical protein
MEEVFVPFGLLLVVIAPLGSFIWQYRRVRRGLSSRFKGTVLYSAYAAAPVFLYVGVFIALAVIEEMLGTSLVGEGYARSLLMVGVGGILLVVAGTIVFAAVMVLVDDTPARKKRTRSGC